MSLLIEKGDYLFLGIDGGGSNCRALICDPEGRALGRGKAGRANPLHGYQRTIESITAASKEALKDAGLSVSDSARLVAGIGLAGLNLPEMMEKMIHWQSPFYQAFYTTDLAIANIGAHGGGEGAAIIVGTGSCGLSSYQGRENTFGGYGFPVGDQASGAWLGLKAVEQALLELDGFSPVSGLTRSLCEFLQVGTGSELSAKTVGHPSKQYAQLAGLVIEAAERGEQFAAGLLENGNRYIQQLIDKLIADTPQRLSMLGGLSSIYQKRLPASYQKKISAPLLSAEQGAVEFAKNSLQQLLNQDRRQSLAP